MLRKWRRLDEPGLEVMRLMSTADGFCATSSLVHAGSDSFALRYIWHLDHQWHTRRLHLSVLGADERQMDIERMGASSWAVDGVARPDLGECDEVDLSATPLCNTLSIKRLAGTGELTTLYVDLPRLEVSPSRQRYEIVAPNRWRFIDLGVAKGFKALIDVDAEDFVTQYEGLFEILAT